MSSRSRRNVIVGAGACGLVVLAGWAIHSAVRSAASLKGRVLAPGGLNAPMDLARPDVEPGSAAESARELASAPEPVVAQATEAPASDAAQEALVRARDALRSALEASLFNTLDPAAILDAALSLGSLEVDLRAYSEPDPSGSIVYPLLGVPEGTRAELWVGRSSRPEVERVLSLRIELDPTEPPYAFEGCPRSKAIAQIQMQLDRSGHPLNMTILTDFPPSARTRDLGVVLDTATLSQGLLCYFDASDPLRWRARNHGLDEGKPGSWPTDEVKVAGRWPAPEKMDALSGLLQSKYATIRH